MVYKIPDGFDELARLVMKENPVTEKIIPDDKEDIWLDLVWHIFLSDNRTESQVNYIFDELYKSKILDIKNIENADESELKNRMIYFIKKKMNNRHINVAVHEET